MDLKSPPWGNLSWTHRRLNLDGAFLFGCLSPEDRSIAVGEELDSLGISNTAEYVEILDSRDLALDPGHKKRNKLASQVAGSKMALSTMDLLCDDDDILDLAESIVVKAAESAGPLVIDISSMPKRYFFPAIAHFMRSASVEDLVVTYAEAQQYSANQLAGNPQAGLPFAGFGQSTYPDVRCEQIVVSAGFGNPGFADLFEQQFEAGVRVLVLLPFPSDAPRYNRHWQFIRDLYGSSAREHLELIPTPSQDVGLSVAKIRQLTGEGARPSVFLPYGPKPTSLAMCLSAITLSNSPAPPSVLYAQPTSYAPDYSTGVATKGGEPHIHCYAIKIGGELRL